MRKKIRFGVIGLGLMGRELGSSIARWCHLLYDGPAPVITGICDKYNKETGKWFLDNFPTIEIDTDDYRELIKSDKIDVVYCAVPHNLHERMYIDIIKAGKHLLGEKPFGIDKRANDNILKAVQENPDIIVRCNSQFPYFPEDDICNRFLSHHFLLPPQEYVMRFFNHYRVLEFFPFSLGHPVVMNP